jgi:hypothetical protein
MRKVALILIALLLSVGLAYGQDKWTVEPMYPDLVPNDGFLDKGTWQNPYVIRDFLGNTKGTIKPLYPDLHPNDGFLDSGTVFNPWVIEPE